RRHTRWPRDWSSDVCSSDLIPPFPEAPASSVIGDCWHRFYVRMLELVESIKICEQGLQRYPTAQGSHRADQPKHLPAGEAYVEKIGRASCRERVRRPLLTVS